MISSGAITLISIRLVRGLSSCRSIVPSVVLGLLFGRHNPGSSQWTNCRFPDGNVIRANIRCCYALCCCVLPEAAGLYAVSIHMERPSMIKKPETIYYFPPTPRLASLTKGVASSAWFFLIFRSFGGGNQEIP